MVKYMALNKELIKIRLKEAFGNDTQKVVGEKLHITQGTVSKLLSGDMDPTGEQLQNIASVYGVSVDWILGVSDKKTISKDKLTYADILRWFCKLGEMGAIWPWPGNMITANGMDKEIPQIVSVGINDEILQSILYEWKKMVSASPDIYNIWLEKRLIEYSEIPYMMWCDELQELFHQTSNTWDVNPEFLQKFYELYQEELKKREN